MLHSCSDLDTYVRDYQTERQREADQARRIDEATRGNGHAPDPLALGLAQLLQRTRTWLSYLMAGKDAEMACAESTSGSLATAVNETLAPAMIRRSAEPYKDMVVVAHGVRETAARQ